MEQALCENVDGVPSAQAALAVATATELGRWEPTRDFRMHQRRLELAPSAKHRCDDDGCWNIQAILDLQDVRPGEVELGGASFDGERFRQALARDFEEQQRCEVGRPGREGDCRAERHELELDSVAPGACDTVYTFHARTPNGRPLDEPERLARRLIYAGYPENEYLSFTSTTTSVSIDPTYGLNPLDDTSSGTCSAACLRVSRSSLAGDCCSCGGELGSFERSAWSSVTFVCR